MDTEQDFTDIDRYGDQKLLQVAKAISNVLIAAGQDRMIKIPAPEGTIHLQP